MAVVLHAHLPFVRHPEHAHSLEERWLFEALTESYIPLLQTLSGWERDGIPGKITFSITPPLCAMLRDPLLQGRYSAHLNDLVRLADLEIHRTRWEKPVNDLALFYYERLQSVRRFYDEAQRDLPAAFARMQAAGRIEIMASAATHAVLPLLRTNPASLRAQVLIGCDQYEECFGVPPRGFWLPECAWAGEIDGVLADAGIQWFITETRGILQASPKPRYGPFAPVITPSGVAAFGRDHASARQVWSRDEGYPGDYWYRDFYRDIGFDLDLEYVRNFLAVPNRRGFTGIKYHRITGTQDKDYYNRGRAMERASEHARHFQECRSEQLSRLLAIFEHPIVVCPYDAELFGHWWYEGPEFLDALFRRNAAEPRLQLTTPGTYLGSHPTHQAATPAGSSWGEQGFWRVWLNEKNHWITAELVKAQERIEAMASLPDRGPEFKRALTQAARELLLAQSSDWPFIIRTGTSPEYAARRVKVHLLRFWRLSDQIADENIDTEWLSQLEAEDNLFARLDTSHWDLRGTTVPKALRSTHPRARNP